MADRESRRKDRGERRRSDDGERGSSRNRSSSSRREEPGRAKRESRSRRAAPAPDDGPLSDRLLSPISRTFSRSPPRDRSLPSTPVSRGNLGDVFGGAPTTDAPPREGTVSIAVRCRPSEVAADADADGAMSVDPARRLVSLEAGSSMPAQSLTASCVLPASAGQEQVFDKLGKRLLETLRQGRHCTLLAFGPSGSGKSFTLVGSLAPSAAAAAGEPEPADYHPSSLSGALASPIAADGIGPSDGLAVRLGVRLLREAEDGTVRLRWLLLGGDNTTCHDLLEHEGLSEPGEPGAVSSPSREPLPPPLPLQPPEAEGEDGSGSARQLVAGAREWRCGDAATLRRLLRAGAARQAAWATLHGEISAGEISGVPHAHGVLQLWSDHDAADAPRITLVDLAASDHVVDSACGGDSATQQLKMAASSSLASLGGVLQQLAAGRHAEARFKELKLTQLLQPWLPPRGELWLLATVSTAAEQRTEARRTLELDPTFQPAVCMVNRQPPASTLHPPPSALHHPPSTLHPPDSNLQTPPSTLRPPPSTFSALHPPPSALRPPPSPKPGASHATVRHARRGGGGRAGATG